MGEPILVESLLSRLLAASNNATGADIDAARRALHALDALPHDVSSKTPGRGAKRLLRDLGIQRHELRAQWERLVHEQGQWAALDTELLEAFVPRELWHPLEELITAGPTQAITTISSALYVVAQRQLPAKSSRDAGPISRRAVTSRREAFKRLLKCAVHLRAVAFPDARLDGWTFVPEIEMPSTAAAETDRSAAPLWLVRATAHDLDAEVKRRLECEAGELARLRALSIVNLTKAGVWTVMRKRLILVLVTVTGSRVGSLSWLRHEDYDGQHVFPDGDVGPALRFTHVKGHPVDRPFWKGLAARDAELVEGMMLLARRLYCERVPRLRCSWAKAPQDRPWPQNAFLLAAEIWNPTERPSEEAMTHMLGGSAVSDPLLPTVDQRRKRANGRPNGYSAHRLRSTTEQVVIRTAARQLLVDEEHLVTGRDVADAVLDHKVRSDPMGYGDVQSRKGRERWTRYGIELASRSLCTDEGAHRIIDADAFAENVRARLAVESRIARLEEQHRKLLDDVDAGLLVGQDHVARVIVGLDELRRAEALLDRLRQAAEGLASDRRRWRIVPDREVPTTAAITKADLEVIESRLRDAVSAPDDITRLPLGDDRRATWRERRELA